MKCDVIQERKITIALRLCLSGSFEPPGRPEPIDVVQRISIPGPIRAWESLL